jgi:broad specificity phosphatase PhoE
LEYFISLDVISKDELRERYFGTLDGTILINYNKVWPVDNLDAHNKRYDVESVHEVIVRVSQLVSMLEQEYEGKHIVMASHADTLQIFQTYMSMSDPRKFSQYRFKNGEVMYACT